MRDAGEAATESVESRAELRTMRVTSQAGALCGFMQKVCCTFRFRSRWEECARTGGNNFPFASGFRQGRDEIYVYEQEIP